MGAWGGAGNFDTSLNIAASTTDVVIIRVRGGYRLPPCASANVYVPPPPRRSKVEEYEDPEQAERARLRRQHRIDMIEVGRELRLSREGLLHANRLLAFALEQPPPNRIMERLSPCPRAPPVPGPPCAAR